MSPLSPPAQRLPLQPSRIESSLASLNLNSILQPRPRSPLTTSTLSSLNIPAPPSPDLVSDAGMRVNLRMRFTCAVWRTNDLSKYPAGTPSHIEAASFEVLNELVIDRGPSPYVSNLELYASDDDDGTGGSSGNTVAGTPSTTSPGARMAANDNLLTVIQADGIIFSTPTGSTAYSLSAGGSLVHPDIPAILLTPICPHTLSFRPMLLSDSILLRVAVPRGSRATAWCSFDGKGRVELRQGDYVTLSASRYPFPVVEAIGAAATRGRGGVGWMETVSRTLRWNTREARQKAWGTGGVAGNARSRRVSGGLATPVPTEEDDEDERASEQQFDNGGEGEEDDAYDIEIDNDGQDDHERSSAKDSGYGGETDTGASGPRTRSGSGDTKGTATPTRRGSKTGGAAV